MANEGVEAKGQRLNVNPFSALVNAFAPVCQLQKHLDRLPSASMKDYKESLLRQVTG